MGQCISALCCCEKREQEGYAVVDAEAPPAYDQVAGPNLGAFAELEVAVMEWSSRVTRDRAALSGGGFSSKALFKMAPGALSPGEAAHVACRVAAAQGVVLHVRFVNGSIKSRRIVINPTDGASDDLMKHAVQHANAISVEVITGVEMQRPQATVVVENGEGPVPTPPDTEESEDLLPAPEVSDADAAPPPASGDASG